jgi:hypothetical protein
MSLSFQKLNPILVRDPRTIVDNMRDYAILKSGSQTTWKQFTTTSVSTSSIQFSCPPPSGGVLVDRKLYFYLPMRITLTGVPPAAATIIRPNQDAPRAYPIASIIDTIQASINNQSVTVNMADIVHALLHYNTDAKLKNHDYSMAPSYPDQSQNYSDLNGSNRSPLMGYDNNGDETVSARGGFAYWTVVANPAGNGTTPVTAVIDIAVCEPLFLLSPYFWGCGNSSAFFNVTTMDFNITFLGNAAYRAWSHDPSGVTGTQLGTGVTNNSSTIQFSNFGSSPAPFSFSQLGLGAAPLMLFQYITPQESQVLSPNMAISYPYFDVPRYPTDWGSAVNPNAQVTIPSNNIQLNSIPRRLYIYVRMKNQDLFSSPSNTDTFFQINNVNVQFQNKSGLLANANMDQLYEMSVKNHCNMTWTQWSGGSVYVNNTLAFKVGTMGGVLCIEFATDIGLESLDAPGKLGQFMLSVQVTCTNINQTLPINPTLYLVPVLEGVFTIEGLGRSSTNVGVISSKDILDSQSRPFVNYNDVESVNGGDFLSGLKDFGRKLVSGLKTVHDFIKDQHLISKGLSFIPHPGAQIASKAAETLGYGEGDYGYGEGEGVLIGGEGVSIGGRRMGRSELRKRLR